MLESLNASFLVYVAVTTIISYWIFTVFLKNNHKGKNLPGGSLGFPLIGESISFIRAQSQNRGEEWIDKRVSKYGPVFKTSLLGSPTVVIIGQAGNKLILGSGDDVITAKQPKSVSAIAGKNNLFELPKHRSMLFKDTMVGFLKPESLQHHVKRFDSLVSSSLLKETQDTDTVMAVNLMKRITFDATCTILVGLYDEQTKESLLKDFIIALKAFWSIPINFPGTTFSKGIAARQRIIDTMLPIIKKKKEDLVHGVINPKSDVLSCLLSIRKENEAPVTEMEVIDSFFTLLIASHDTTASLSSLMIWKLAQDQNIYKRIQEENMAILNGKGEGEEQLTWNDIQKMKYTWRVAQEVMRVIPMLFCSFRKVVKDTSFAGYDIPKGWQVVSAACGTHMNKEIFDDPTTFDPSRFESPSKRIPPYTYIPFGAGTHMCIGNEFGRIETLTIIHHMVTKFEWAQLNPDESIARTPMPYPSMGLPIKLKKIHI